MGDTGMVPPLHRTEDLLYGAEYWDTLDGGNGYTDSLLWSDMAHIISEVFFVDRKANIDRAGEHSVLDVGCAFGYLVRHIQRRGTECFGLDYSTYALDHVPDDVKGRVAWFDLTGVNDTHFGRDRFTLVTCFEVLEHLPAASAPAAIGHILNSLKPGGSAVLTICVEGQPDPQSDPTHVNVAPREWWEALFDKTDVVVDYYKARQLRKFWLFSAHKGIFVLTKPSLTPTPDWNLK